MEEIRLCLSHGADDFLLVKQQGKFIPVLLFGQVGTHMSGESFISAPGGEAVPLRAGAGQVLVCILLKVRQNKAGEESLHTADHIAEFPVQLF